MPSTCSTTFADFAQRAGFVPARGAPVSHVGAAMPAKVLQRSGRGRAGGSTARYPPKPTRTTAKSSVHVKALNFVITMLLVTMMYMIQDGFSDYAWPYFVLLIISGSIIIINLFLAVISGGYELSMSEEIETARFKKNAVECIEMLKSTVHAAIIQPTEVKCRVGQKVQLNEAAISRLESRNRDQVRFNSILIQFQFNFNSILIQF